MLYSISTKQDQYTKIFVSLTFKPEELEKFSTSLREVLGCIKYSKDKEKLSSFIRNNTRMTLERNAARVIQTITSITRIIEKQLPEIRFFLLIPGNFYF